MTGIAGRPRIYAFIIDNLFSLVAAFLMVAMLKPNSGYIGGSVFCLTYLAYFFIFEALWARTPGKYFQGLLVVNQEGARCTWRGAFIRTLMRVIEANPL
ncbi:MAG: RDD family protein, partial [Acidobacteriota bacterium]|nr:RDD family protein [Acidobacteriota bacterium]